MPTRPPFTGIHEQFPDSGGGVPHEGGGDLPPFGEDMFQRVVDINFGGVAGVGAIFTCGDYCCFVRTGMVPLPPEEQVWSGLGAPVFTDRGSCNGGTSAIINGRPTFLICGGNPEGGAVALSHDGYEWIQTYGTRTIDAPDTVRWPYMQFLIWDAAEQTFYGYTSGYLYNGVEYIYGNRIYISKTGYDWTLTTLTLDDFWNHVQNPYGEPDGIVGYNPDSDKWMRPEELTERFESGELHVDGVAYMEYTYVWATAFAGGIWAATANAYIEDFENSGLIHFANIFIVSFDDGVTWVLGAYGDLGGGGDYSNPDLLGISLEHFR